jgi:hypothetical protein
MTAAISRGKVVEPIDPNEVGAIVEREEDILDALILDDDMRMRESHFNRPLDLLPLIEREAQKDSTWLVANDAHDCIRDRNCTLKPLTVWLCRLLEGPRESIHICFPRKCKHLGGPLHKCTTPATCPHRFAYAAKDVYKYDALYMCDRVGRVHLCGKHCSCRFTDLTRGGLHTCPLTGIVLQSQLEGPMDNYQRQIVGGDSLEEGDEDNNHDPALGAAHGDLKQKRLPPSTLLMLTLPGGNASGLNEENLQIQLSEWRTTARDIIMDVLTTTKMSPMQVVAPVLELLTALRAKKQIAAVESGEISIIDMVSRVYKVLPPPEKIHPAWKTPARGENPLRLAPPINKDNIRRWKRIQQLFSVGEGSVSPEKGPPADELGRIAVESYMMYARKCMEVHSKITYSFKQMLPYILYQMRHGLSVPLYTPKIGIKHSTVPFICIIPKVEIMAHLPPAELFEMYDSVKSRGMNSRTLARAQKITSFIIELYQTI